MCRLLDLWELPFITTTVKKKSLKNPGLNRIGTHDPAITGAVTENLLSYHAT